MKPIDTFNRTSLESKHLRNSNLTDAILNLLIEPVWNRNILHPKLLVVLGSSFNRTSLESKPEPKGRFPESGTGF